MSETAASEERPEQGWQLAEAAERLQALGIHRPEGQPAVVMVPRDPARQEAPAVGQLDDGPNHPPAEVVASRFTTAEVRDLLSSLTARDWSPTAASHFYAFFYDGAHDAISITTDAPEEDRRLLAERYGDRVIIRYGRGGRR